MPASSAPEGLGGGLVNLKPPVRYQPRTPIAICTVPGCPEDFEITGSPHSRVAIAKAILHHDDTGHQVRVIAEQEWLIGQRGAA